MYQHVAKLGTIVRALLRLGERRNGQCDKLYCIDASDRKSKKLLNRSRYVVGFLWLSIHDY